MTSNTPDTSPIAEGRDLVKAAKRGLLAPADFREDDVRAALEVLDRGRSLLLVGPQGAGKTAIVYDLARAMAVRGRGALLELSTTGMLAGTRYLGEWQTKITTIADQAIKKRVILYIPDIVNLPDSGRTAQSDANMLDALRPALARGLILLGEATPEGQRAMGRHIGFVELFQVQRVHPLAPARVEECLALAAQRAGLPLSAAARVTILSLTRRFLPSRPQPGPALELLEACGDDWKRRQDGEAELGPARVERVFGATTGLPAFVIGRDETRSPSELRRWFRERLVGQEDAIEAVIEVIALFKAGLHDPARPLGTLFFVGPTGVGKTELARALATFLFGSPHRLLRFDLSEYKDYHSFEILLGSARDPSRPAALVDPVRAQPFQVVLLDELEKAHPNIWDLLLPLLDEGRLTPPGGSAVDFRNTILIATSNLGAAGADRALGFTARGGPAERRARTLEALEGSFRPEFLNRFQHVVVFQPLTLDQVRAIARQELRRVLAREGITGRGLVVDVDDDALDLAIQRGHDPRYGARALKRELQRQLVLPLALTLMEQPVGTGQILRVVARNGQVRVRVLDTAESRAERREQEPVRASTGERLTREDIARGLLEARARLEVLAEALREPLLIEGRDRLLERRRSPEFWQDSEGAARAMRDLDRVSGALDRLDRLRGFVEEVEEDLGRAQRRQTLEEVARKLGRLEASVQRARRELLVLGWEGSWDALVEVAPIGAGGRLARDHLALAYAAWGQARGSVDWLRDPTADDEPVLMAIKAPYAAGLLRLEAGLHRVRAEELTSVARVRVAPWTDAAGPVVVRGHRALKQAGTFTDKLRSCLELEGGLVLRNDRNPQENRELALEVAPSWAKAPPPSDQVVRRYDLDPPRVRDALTGLSSGRPDQLAPELLQELLCLRVDVDAEARRPSVEAP